MKFRDPFAILRGRKSDISCLLLNVRVQKGSSLCDLHDTKRAVELAQSRKGALLYVAHTAYEPCEASMQLLPVRRIRAWEVLSVAYI